jgi:hypothetical protein
MLDHSLLPPKASAPCRHRASFSVSLPSVLVRWLIREAGRLSLLTSEHHDPQDVLRWLLDQGRDRITENPPLQPGDMTDEELREAAEATGAFLAEQALRKGKGAP